jgi:signal transduction histidine kinase/DNA-binding NarL/FixJ family response regulator
MKIIDYINFAVIILIFYNAFFQLILYYGRRKIEKIRYIFYFIIFCIFANIYIYLESFGFYLHELEKIYHFFPLVSGLSTIFMVISSVHFLFILFEFKKKFIKFLWISYTTSFLATLGTLIAIFNYKFYIIQIYPIVVSLISLTVIFISVIITIILILKKSYTNKNALISYIGYCCLIFSFTFDKLFPLLNIYYPLNGNFIGVGIAVVLFSQAFTVKINNEYKQLIELKSTLETKVYERTQEIEQAHQKLKEENQKRIDFFINLAHETRTPLSLISNYFNEYIKKIKPTIELLNIKSNFEKLLRDMVNFLDIEKLNRDQIFYDHSHIIELYEILKNKVELFKELAKKRNIDIILKNNTRNIVTKIDSLAIDRVLNNLLDNAVKYNKDNGKINIILENNAGFIDLIIKDTGIGISEDEINYIFEPYHQMFHEKRQIQGLGMGLTIVKKIIDEVNGKICFNSKLNEGTTIIITFQEYNLQEKDKIQRDIEYSQPADYPIVELKPESYNKEKFTVFIVEDNIEFLSLLQNSLTKEYNFYYAKNGKEALDKLNGIHEPDVIIADIMMPIMDGYSFYDELIKIDRFKETPFIFVTARTGVDDRLKGLNKGAVDFITKPIITEELIVKINNIIKRKNYVMKKAKEFVGIEFEKSMKTQTNDNETIEIIFEKKCNELNISKRYKDVIKEFLIGKEYKEIGITLNKSEKTIRNYIQEIYKKLEVKNKQQLMILFKDCIGKLVK